MPWWWCLLRRGKSKLFDGASNAKRKYVHTPASRKKSRGQTESLLTEMKETMNTLKTLASDNSSKEILNFWNEESQRQAAKDDAFFENNDCISSTATSLNYVIRPMPEPRNQFRHSMTNLRPNSSMVSHQRSMSQDLGGLNRKCHLCRRWTTQIFHKTYLYFVWTSKYCTYV